MTVTEFGMTVYTFNGRLVQSFICGFNDSSQRCFLAEENPLVAFAISSQLFSFSMIDHIGAQIRQLSVERLTYFDHTSFEHKDFVSNKIRSFEIESPHMNTF